MRYGKGAGANTSSSKPWQEIDLKNDITWETWSGDRYTGASGGPDIGYLPVEPRLREYGDSFICGFSF
jgi:hypothetical protein